MTFQAREPLWPRHYDAADQLTTVARPDGTTLVNAYDPNGNLSSQRDAEHNATTYGYDALDRVVSVTDPLGRTTTYGYDGAGNRTSLRDAQGQTTTLGYDAGDQLTSLRYADGTTPDVGYAYDAVGRRSSMTYGAANSSYRYDSLDRLTQVTNGNAQTVDYAYDLAGRVTALTYPNRRQVTRSFDAAGRLEAVSDWLGHTTRFGYDADSNLTTQSFPGGAEDRFDVDAADRIMAVTFARDTSPYASFSYTRDNGGRLASSTPTGNPQGPETYGYSRLDQLTGVNAGRYSYDAADNLTGLLDGTTQAYDAANQLTSSHGPQTASFGYDGRGNRTSASRALATATYGYDQANRLTSAVGTPGAPVAGVASYSYDGDGLRATKVTIGAPELYAWDQSGELPLLLTDGTSSYLYGPGGLPVQQIGPTGTASFFHHDQLGSTRALTDTSGATVATFAYDPYGRPAGSTGSLTTPFAFAGQYTDAETGFVYLRARYYDRATGQFISRDPITGITQEPYGYVGGNPLNRVDPRGLCAWDACVVEGATVGIGVYVAGAAIIGTVGWLLSGGDRSITLPDISMPFAKRSGKEKASDIPSWVDKQSARVLEGETPSAAADRVMRERYGDQCEYPKGPGSEYSKIKKWVSRNKK